jgi:chemosensory pili system protein ChpA (sensor histidine kinase/response regulator)
LRWLAGGTILPDGRVALIVDALALLRSGVLQDYLPTAVLRAGTGDAPVCVMVVDDSLTVRRVTARLLRRQSMEVLTAKDGVEALTLLDERKPDIMLLDIEMPRMDGYELTRHVRRSERLKDLPIIMITSRTGDKHRDHAMALGVDRFLGKPYQESELLDEINSALAGRQG